MSPTNMALTQPEMVELVLREVALHGGAIEATLRLLRENVEGVPHANTVAKWIHQTHAERYQELQVELEGVIRERMARKALDLAQKAGVVTDELLEELRAKIGEVKPDQLAPSARAVSQVHASSIEKAELLQGRPTQRIEQQGLDELVEALAKEVTHAQTIDGEAIEESEPAGIPAATND